MLVPVRKAKIKERKERKERFQKLKGKKEVTPVGEARWQEAVEQLRKEFQQALTKKADKTDYESV